MDACVIMQCYATGYSWSLACSKWKCHFYLKHFSIQYHYHHSTMLSKFCSLTTEHIEHVCMGTYYKCTKNSSMCAWARTTKCTKNSSMCVSVINTAIILTGYIDYFSHSAIVETTILQRTGKAGGEDDGFSLSICSSLRLTLVLHSISLLLPT